MENDTFCNLKDSINTIIKFKSLNTAKKHVCLILTDGLFDLFYKNKLKDNIRYGEECGINFYGIGLGLYPKGISDIFSKCIWCLNPDLIGKALSIFHGNDIPDSNEIFATKLNIKANKNEIYSKILENPNEYIRFHSLKKYLEDKPLYNETFEEIVNKDKANEIIKDNIKLSEETTMCTPNSFKGLKCLLCVFWSKSIAGIKEQEWVDYKYFTERYNNNQKCLSEVFDYYGIELIVKIDYISCIKELEKGLYYACWVVCGDGSGILPEGGNANIVGQFVECAIKFWMQGGALVWWCDNEPLTYEANLFLEKVEFPGDVTKTKVRFKSNHKGKKTMHQGDIKVIKKGVFNNKRKFLGKYERLSLAHGLVKMYMGDTISFVEVEDIEPFIPFGYDDEGGLSIIFYPSNPDYPHGDIIIDGGFTKLLYELETEGTERYILNIISWTTQYSRRYDELKLENWTEVNLFPSFEFLIDETVIWNGFTERKSVEFDIIYMADATGSMLNYNLEVKNQCINISIDLKKKYPSLNFNFGAIFYRDPIDSISDKHDLIPLTNDLEYLQKSIGEINA